MSNDVDWLIGLDIGTSAVKGVLISARGEQRARGKRTTRFIRPQPDICEVDAEEHYRSVCELIRELAASVPSGDRVRALSMAFASGNTMLLDKALRPVGNIHFWLDNRTKGRTAELLPGFDLQAFQRINGWHYSELFPLSHIAWFRDNYPQQYKEGRVCMNSDYLMFRLCGRWGMDPSTATTFHLQDQERRCWYRPYLDFLNLREQQISPIMESGQALGPLTPEAAADTSLSTDTLVVLGAFDHPCAARGTGVFEVGELLLSCGTSWVGFYPIADREPGIEQALLVDPFLSPQGPWAAMFSLTAVAVTIDRYLDRFVLSGEEGNEDRHELFNRHAQAVGPGADGFMLDIYQNNTAFLNDNVELDSSLSRPQICRALMESVSFEMRRKIKQLDRAGISARRITMVGGPTESPIWPRIVSEVTGLPLKLLNGQTAGAVGAAMLAAVGAALYCDSQEAFKAMGGDGTVIRPAAAATSRYDELYRQYVERYAK